MRWESGVLALERLRASDEKERESKELEMVVVDGKTIVVQMFGSIGRPSTSSEYVDDVTEVARKERKKRRGKK